MEFLLLWADELDDALAVLRHYAPRILGLLAALALFAATGFALVLRTARHARRVRGGPLRHALRNAAPPPRTHRRRPRRIAPFLPQVGLQPTLLPG